VKGKVVVLADYGAFVEIQPGVEGLVHVSEMSWGTHLRSAQDFVKVGQEVDTVVLGIDREDRKMSLGIKQLTPDPWASITTKYPLSSIHKGTVRNFTNFGVFLELEEGIDGLVHISDLSWTKKVKHPSEFTSVGAIMEVKVLDIDESNRRLSLGHKQTSENPWDNYEGVFEVGTLHTGKVSEAVDKGFNVLFETFGVEGFCPSRHATKEDGASFIVGDVLEFKVLEFNRDSRRILVSHAQTHKEMPAEEKSSGGSKGKKSNSGNSGINEVNAAVEKTTLGDLDALLRLKDQMDNNA
jgi:small subunit ribosomal protein S1